MQTRPQVSIMMWQGVGHSGCSDAANHDALLPPWPRPALGPAPGAHPAASTAASWHAVRSCLPLESVARRDAWRCGNPAHTSLLRQLEAACGVTGGGNEHCPTVRQALHLQEEHGRRRERLITTQSLHHGWRRFGTVDAPQRTQPPPPRAVLQRQPHAGGPGARLLVHRRTVWVAGDAAAARSTA